MDREKPQISKLELKCVVKTFTETKPVNKSAYRNCYNCSGYVNLPCYREPKKEN